MAEFGELMAELRLDRGLTQKELGRILSVSTGTISNYENGVHYPDLEKLVILADYFCVSTDYLLGRRDYAVPELHSKARKPQDEVIGQILRDLASLPDDRRQALGLIISDMAKHSPALGEGNTK